MTRWIAALAALGLAGTAHAGGYIAGGFHGNPSPAASFATGMPSLKIGAGTRKFAGYGSIGFARGGLGEDRAYGIPRANAWAAKPMVGFRPALGDADKPVVAVLEAGAYTWIWGLGGDPGEVDPPEQDADAGLRPIGGLLLGLGLDGEINDNLSISAEVGVDYFTAGYQFDGWVYHGDMLTTWSALYVNIWL